MDPHRLNTPPANGRQVRDVNGRKLDKALKAGTVQPGFAAWLAYRMQSGAVFLHHLTAQQACALTGATCADLAAERRKHRSANGNGRRVLYRRAATDNDIDAVVTKLGTEKVWRHSTASPGRRWSRPSNCHRRRSHNAGVAFLTSGDTTMLDMTSRELEDAIEDVRGQVRKQSNRIEGLSYEYGREIERLKTAVRQIQAALNLPQLADEN